MPSNTRKNILTFSLALTAITAMGLTGCQSPEDTSDDAAASATNSNKTVATVKTDAAHRRAGFETRSTDMGLWVFYEESPELKTHDSGLELEKHVSVIRNVDGDILTIKAPDRGIITAYLAAKPGYTTRMVDDQLWVFALDSEPLAAYLADGSVPPDHFTRIVNMQNEVVTVKAPTREVYDGYAGAN